MDLFVKFFCSFSIRSLTNTHVIRNVEKALLADCKHIKEGTYGFVKDEIFRLSIPFKFHGNQTKNLACWSAVAFNSIDHLFSFFAGEQKRTIS